MVGGTPGSLHWELLLRYHYILKQNITVKIEEAGDLCDQVHLILCRLHKAEVYWPIDYLSVVNRCCLSST